MSVLKNDLEKVWRSDFQEYFKTIPWGPLYSPYNMDRPQIGAMEAGYIVGRKKAQEEADRVAKELQKTTSHLQKAIKSAEFFSSHADCRRDSWACKCSFCRDTESSKNLGEARQYLEDKLKGGL